MSPYIFGGVKYMLLIKYSSLSLSKFSWLNWYFKYLFNGSYTNKI